MKTAIRFSALYLSAWMLVSNSHLQAQDHEELDSVKRLRIAVQDKFDKLPVVKVNTDKDKVGFTTLDLGNTLTEVNGEKYYAFRFRSPKVPADMTWAFNPGEGFVSWYIVPEKDRMQGFERFTRTILPNDVEGFGMAGDTCFLQWLDRKHMKTDSGYIIRFKFKDVENPKVSLSLNFIAKRPKDPFKTLFPMIPEPKKKAPAASSPSDKE